MKYEYRVLVTREVVNEQYEEQMQSYQRNQRWNSNEQAPQRTQAIKTLEMLLTEEEFDAVRKAALEVMENA
jgi:hypothetical protein